ncbi:hypothetical protein WJX72_005511 [[Myrmecia] bisecta]|uniref:Uncharacterized protein n=1 Tax=[Myrmecia] bisecta TaxID=41462 RepID=A0AAW1PTT0_9CHLO
MAEPSRTGNNLPTHGDALTEGNRQAQPTGGQVGEMGAGLSSAAGKAGTGVYEGVGNLGSSAYSGVGKAGQAIGTGARDVGSAAYTTTGQALGAVGETASTVGSSVLDAGKSVGGAIGSLFGAGAHKARLGADESGRFESTLALAGETEVNVRVHEISV